MRGEVVWNNGRSCLLLAEHDTLELVLEPFDGLGLGHAVVGADAVLATPATTDAETRAGKHDEEVDADLRIVLDAEIDVLVDTEAEGASVGEVPGVELVLLDLEALLEDLSGLLATDGDVNGDLLVTLDREGTDGEAGLRLDGGLTAELLEHLGGTGKTISALTHANVEDQLVDLQLAHRVLLLGPGRGGSGRGSSSGGGLGLRHLQLPM